MRSRKAILVTASILTLLIFAIVCLSPSFKLYSGSNHPQSPNEVFPSNIFPTNELPPPGNLLSNPGIKTKTFRSIGNQVEPSLISKSPKEALITKSLVGQRNQDQVNDLRSEPNLRSISDQKSEPEPDLKLIRTKPFDPCSGNPCNYGICVVDGDHSSTKEPSGGGGKSRRGYSCYCHDGYTGLDCSINHNECSSSPCLNNGTCVDGNGVYYCSCMPGFCGSQCESEIDECRSTPCFNGGTCVDLVNGYKCICPREYLGTNCEMIQGRRGDCSSYCLHGSCLIKSTRDHSNPSQTKGDIICTCDPGFTGSRCDININECSTDPCLNGGSCFDYINHYHCSCPLGNYEVIS